MTQSNQLNIGVVGTGGIFRAVHSPAWAKHPEADIVGLCDVEPDKAQPHAQAHNVPESRVFTDYHDLLGVEEIDAVDICTPNKFHSQIAIAALEAGKAVFVEKPDAINAEEAQKMADAAERSGKLLMAMRNNRFRADSRYLKALADEGQMGELYTGRCGWIRRRGIPGKGGWFTTRELSGGGPLIDLGVHMIDLAMWIMGDPKPVAVSGATYCKFAHSDVSDSVHAQFGEAKAGGTFDVEDLATGFIRFDNQASLQIEFSWASNIEREKRFVELRGSKSGFTFEPGQPPKLFTEDHGTACQVNPQPGKLAHENHEGAIFHFVDCLQGRAQPTITPQEGLHMIQILTAIYESAQSGHEVQL